MAEPPAGRRLSRGISTEHWLRLRSGLLLRRARCVVDVKRRALGHGGAMRLGVVVLHSPGGSQRLVELGVLAFVSDVIFGRLRDGEDVVL